VNAFTALQKECIIFIVTVVELSFVYCTPAPFQYKLSSTYSMDTFSGGDINNRTIGVCPLLTEEGPISEKKIPYSLLSDTLRIHRPELKFNLIQSNRYASFHKVAPQDILDFYAMLYHGRMVQLQTVDTVWKAIGFDYLLVFYVRYGMSVHTFNRAARKQVRLEAELWDCNELEAVWRVTADGTCLSNNVSDIQFLTYGIGTIVSALPALTPSYDKGTW
jgi:hypothetical protein